MFAEVTQRAYAEAFGTAREESALVREATSPVEDVTAQEAAYYLSQDVRSGFVVRHSGELVGVFSLERGRGNALVDAAVKAGADTLDCFDGYLPTLYARHGFVVTEQVPNWTPGEPDVVFMARNV